ncbi:MAG: PAS domain S-box protein [Anaerolineales bacterium]|nr:PAS domain S-box protein [Anaerolineales bacterium]
MWNETGVSLRLTMTPAWWQTWWFYTLAGVGVLAIFAVVYQAKANQLRAEKQAAAAIRESEEKYRVLFESFPLGITVTDNTGHILETNPTAETLVGLPKTAHEGRDLSSPVWQIIYPDGRPMPPEAYAGVKALRENRCIENAEMGIIKPGNEITWLNVTAAPIPLEDYGVVVSYSDITARKQVEEKLQRVQYSLDRVADSVFWIGSDGRFIDVNEAACQNLGYSRAELLTMRVFDIDPEWSEETWPSGRQEIQHRQMLLIESVHQKKNGDRFPVEIAAYYQQFGELKYACVFARDITKRKQAEVKMRLQATLLDAVGQAVIATDPGGVITYFNRAAEKLYGWPAAEAIGRNIMEVTVPAFSQAQAAQIMTTMSRGNTWSGEFLVQRRSGASFPAQVYNSPILNETGQVLGIIGISTDISEQKQREQERVRQERLAAVGQLAAGIAHDFNNILTGIIGFAEMLTYQPMCLKAPAQTWTELPIRATAPPN